MRGKNFSKSVAEEYARRVWDDKDLTKKRTLPRKHTHKLLTEPYLPCLRLNFPIEKN